MVTTEVNNTTLEEVSKLTLESQKELVANIVKEIVASKYDDTEIRDSLSSLGIQLNKVEEMASILGDMEKGQVEEMLLQLLNNSNLQDILAGIAVSVAGKSYSIKSVVQAFANVPRVAREEIVEDENGATIGRKLILDDGTVVNLTAKKSVSEDGTEVSFIFEGDAKGFPVRMSSTLGRQSSMVGNIEVAIWRPKVIEHISFDLTQLLSAPITAKSNETVADINADGKVGN
jgi:hypothetical protein